MTRAACASASRTCAKLEPDPRQPRYLVTETGLGYRLRADNDPPPEAVAQGGVG